MQWQSNRKWAITKCWHVSNIKIKSTLSNNRRQCRNHKPWNNNCNSNATLTQYFIVSSKSQRCMKVAKICKVCLYDKKNDNNMQTHAPAKNLILHCFASIVCGCVQKKPIIYLTTNTNQTHATSPFYKSGPATMLLSCQSLDNEEHMYDKCRTHVGQV